MKIDWKKIDAWQDTFCAYRPPEDVFTDVELEIAKRIEKAFERGMELADNLAQPL